MYLVSLLSIFGMSAIGSIIKLQLELGSDNDQITD